VDLRPVQEQPEPPEQPHLLFEQPPQRLVSLVPSLTESLFDLGFGDRVVGVTDYCVEPSTIPYISRVGGTRDARLEDIMLLFPDLVLAGREENARPTIENLRQRGIKVWVTHPTNILDCMNMLWEMVTLFRSPEAMKKVQMLDREVDAARTATLEQTPVRVFCPIWQEENGAQLRWMTFNDQTYPADVLALLGCQNVFGGRRGPEGVDAWRYPWVTIVDVIEADPEIILLPDEPFNFTAEHQKQMMTLFASTTAGRQKRFVRFEGSLLMWYGTRLSRALKILPALLAN